MKELAILLENLLRRAADDWQLKLRAEWSLIMGDISRRARLERINGSIIVIGVYDIHWMHELHALSRILLQRINTMLSPLYPPGFSLTSLRCLLVKQVVKQRKKILSYQEGMTIATPPARMLQKVSHLPAELQASLIDYYIRCTKEMHGT